MKYIIFNIILFAIILVALSVSCFSEVERNIDRSIYHSEIIAFCSSDDPCILVTAEDYNFNFLPENCKEVLFKISSYNNLGSIRGYYCGP